mgnify:CR=1 FL=1
MKATQALSAFVLQRLKAASGLIMLSFVNGNTVNENIS